jgi:hypothetical protein
MGFDLCPGGSQHSDAIFALQVFDQLGIKSIAPQHNRRHPLDYNKIRSEGGKFCDPLFSNG